MLEVAIPHADPDLVEAADTLVALGTQPGLVCGVQGMGFLLNSNWENCIGMFPAAAADYRCAITIPLEAPEDGLVHNSIHDEFFADCAFGIADIGWRTIVGKRLAPRLKLPKQTPGVDVTRSAAAVTLTAGPAPLWGSRKRREDLAPYHAAAKVLKPLLVDIGYASKRYFNGDELNKAFMKSLKAYRDRFDGLEKHKP